MIFDCASTLAQRAIEPGAAEILRPHAGKVLRVELGPAVFCLRICEDGVPRKVHSAISADATVKVPLARLAGGQEPVSTSGDSELLSACRRLQEEADLGPDALIERALGPAAGSLAAVAMQAAGGYAADAGPRLLRTTLNWLTGPGGVLPEPDEARSHAADIADFADRVDQLRDGVSSGFAESGG